MVVSINGASAAVEPRPVPGCFRPRGAGFHHFHHVLFLFLLDNRLLYRVRLFAPVESLAGAAIGGRNFRRDRFLCRIAQHRSLGRRFAGALLNPTLRKTVLDKPEKGVGYGRRAGRKRCQ